MTFLIGRYDLITNQTYNKILLFSSEQMGNKINDKHNDEFIRAVSQMKKNKNEYPVEKVATRLEQRYREHLLDSLTKQKMPKALMERLGDCIEKKIKKEDLTSTISVLNSLRSNNVQQMLRASISQTKAADPSKNVVIKFDERKPKNLNKMTDKNRRATGLMSYCEEDTLEGRIKYTGQFICKQFNKPYHPFRYLCKRFSDILFAYEEGERESKNDNEYEEKQEMQRKTVKDFCHFMVVGCVGIYKKWIIEYTKIQDKKYDKWMHSLVLNQMWGVNEGYMLKAMFKIIAKTRLPLKIDLEGLSMCSSIGVNHPKDFGIDPQLQIQGNFLISVFEMSKLTELNKPALMVKQLQYIQNSICKDVDNYHKLEQKGEIYEINGDNIMGIVAFILSRISYKIQEISVVLLFLKILYGETIYYGMDTSSYMYSTIWGAIEYLESKKFEIPKTESQEKQLKDTSCVESFITSNSNKVNN